MKRSVAWQSLVIFLCLCVTCNEFISWDIWYICHSVTNVSECRVMMPSSAGGLVKDQTAEPFIHCRNGSSLYFIMMKI